MLRAPLSFSQAARDTIYFFLFLLLLRINAMDLGPSASREKEDEWRFKEPRVPLWTELFSAFRALPPFWFRDEWMPAQTRVYPRPGFSCRFLAARIGSYLLPASDCIILRFLSLSLTGSSLYIFGSLGAGCSAWSRRGEEKKKFFWLCASRVIILVTPLENSLSLT